MAVIVYRYDATANELGNQYSYTHPDPIPIGLSAAFDVTYHNHFPNTIPKYFKIGFEW
jgi:hypothetical protein